MLKQVNSTSVSKTLRFCLYATQKPVDQKEVFLQTDVRSKKKPQKLPEKKTQIFQSAPTSYKVESSIDLNKSRRYPIHANVDFF